MDFTRQKDSNGHSPQKGNAYFIAMKGIDLSTVKKLMGHSDIDTTMIYSHLTEKHVDSAVEKLNFQLSQSGVKLEQVLKLREEALAKR